VVEGNVRESDTKEGGEDERKYLSDQFREAAKRKAQELDEKYDLRSKMRRGSPRRVRLYAR
jgi:hypothetical protein